MSIALLFKVVALVLWAVAALGVGSGRFNLTAAGLFFWFLPDVIKV